MNVVLVSVLLFVIYRWSPPLWAVQIGLWAWWHLWLVVNTWRDYLAYATYDRVKRGGKVDLPAAGKRRDNAPEAVWIVEYLLKPPAMLKNFALAQYAALFYFRVVPKPWADVGLTKLLNRLAARGDAVGVKARAVQDRWLDLYDRRGFHI